MRFKRSPTLAVLLASAGVLAACASKPAPTPTVATAADVVAQTGQLSPQTLAPGACGLFLWTQSPPVHFVFFSEAGTNTAVMNIDGTETKLILTSSRGDLFGQFMTQLSYKSPTGNVGVTFTPGELLDGGQRIEGGHLSLINKEGWETMIPVLGLSACQSEAR
jgi:hypothetical protein